ncbi:GNAT family protein [Metasolibacillus meyeri]|uniref:GNAT family protein n=1 Tax=Metasolibacillus meyeri TaxID=1071052 RepID=A0AAW9NW08_9BACL|nr:GNAT family protein [Metasolibacillus meyeri]MEC1180508.1 GNAT family protein [Metasolibacillus meyeri]
MKITLGKLEYIDMKDLYEFELENRTYFEKTVPSRGDDYYHFETFKRKNEELLKEQMQELSYFYLIKNEGGQIVGRINLTDIDKNQHLGHLGYRVGEAYIGKGIANQALQLLLATIEDKGIQQIAAQTTTNNIASQKILEKNGFTYIRTSDEVFEMNGQSLKFVYYKWGC